jgi:hypothetical protein
LLAFRVDDFSFSYACIDILAISCKLLKFAILIAEWSKADDVCCLGEKRIYIRDVGVGVIWARALVYTECSIEAARGKA